MSRRNLVILSCLTLSQVFFAGLPCSGQGSAGKPSTEILETSADALKLVSDEYKFTEGPAVDKDGNVYFTDQPNDRILRVDTQGKVTTWMQPAGRSNGLFFAPNGQLIACADGNNELWSIASDKMATVLSSGFEGQRFNGPNDVWVDADGTCYFTDPYYKRPYWTHADQDPKLPRQVYKLSADGKSLTVAATEFEQPNGIVGDAKQRLLYVADIGAKKTYRFKIGKDGQLSEKTLFCSAGSDGMTLDADGNLYLTGKGVLVFNPAGEQIEHIDVPEGWTANVCFGGVDRKTLYITASDSLYSLQRATPGLR